MLKTIGLFCFTVTFFFSRHAPGQEALAAISINDFKVGRSWTWDYFTSPGVIWSTERYTVIERKGSAVLIEISSDYHGSQNLKPNTRLEVDVDKCLKAYRNPFAKSGWSLRMFSIQADGSWASFDPPTTLAFEEKFNCNAHIFSGRSEPYETVFSLIDGHRVFQQKLWRKISSSWFNVDGDNRAVQFQKEFKADPSQTYVSKLRFMAN